MYRINFGSKEKARGGLAVLPAWSANMRTRITELLGIEAPIIQGAMARIADGRLAAAVSEAGGLGIIACGGAPLSWVREQVAIARDLTQKPIGANVMLMDPGAAETAKLLTDLRVDVITTGAGSPANYLPAWKEAGIKVLPVVASTALAVRMERLGVDAVIAEGTESGGHIGELTTMALVPSVCDALNIPVVAAGGICSGRSFAAAALLGAEGVQMGTRFLTVEECGIADAYKEKVLAAKDADTIVTGRGSGHPVRCLKNKFSRKVRSLEQDMDKNGDALEEMYLGSLRRAVEGDVDNGTMMAGQVAAQVRERKTAAEVVADIMAEAERLGSLGLQEVFDLNARRGEERAR
ncbi:enoyl-[acyl-carrier-protein] reductase FabK [Eggerthellaceae bacterium zg-893]|nr:enoyl-[acyl-carrier-protein] reductase FabK [Eggerthellaceae bacterium zg-893]